MKSSKEKVSILGGIREALKKEDYQTASDLQLVMIEKMNELRNVYTEYKHNLFEE